MLPYMRKKSIWLEGRVRHIPFAIPMIWNEPRDLVQETEIKRINFYSKHTGKYPNLCSAKRPVLHSDNLHGPDPSASVDIDDIPSTSTVCNNYDDDFLVLNQPHFLTQHNLNDLVHGLDLSKKTNLLGSRLKGRNLLNRLLISKPRRRLKKKFHKKGM